MYKAKASLSAAAFHVWKAQRIAISTTRCRRIIGILLRVVAISPIRTPEECPTTPTGRVQFPYTETGRIRPRRMRRVPVEELRRAAGRSNAEVLPARQAIVRAEMVFPAPTTESEPSSPHQSQRRNRQ